MDSRQRLLHVLEDSDTVTTARRYYDEGDGGPAFSGSYFEVLGGRGDGENVKDVIGPADVVAITTLSVRLDGRQAIEVLDQRCAQMTALLEQIPVTATPWTDDGQALLREKTSPLAELWGLLRAVSGPVTAGKLCARKRPALVPIYDSVVGRVLSPPRRKWWSTVADLTHDEEASAAITRVHSTLAPLALERRDVNLTPLRAMDIAVWMVGRQHGVIDDR